MAKRLDVFKCEDCGVLLEVANDVSGECKLTCCGSDMTRLEENTVDAAREKHVPVSEAADGKLKVTVGSTPHPMEDEHFIEWIEVIQGDTVMRTHLKPGQDPSAVFPISDSNATMREHCNIHGLWKA